MNAFTIGLSALAAGRQGLDLAGQNIANASTRGYTRKTANLATRTVDGTNGTGVGITSYTRYNAPGLQSALRSGDSGNASVAVRLDVRRQVESALPSGAGGIADRAEAFATLAGQLTTRPADPTARRQVIAAAQDLAGQFRGASGDLDRLRSSVGGQIVSAVDEVNTYATSIADLNRRISVIESAGGQALELRDQRDRAIDDLSSRIDIRTVDQPNGVVNVIASGAAIVVGEFANRFETRAGAEGRLDVVEAGQTRALGFHAGTLGGLLREHNVDLPATRQRLDELADGVASQWDRIQATGLGLGGPVTSAPGGRGVADPDAPLAGQTSISSGSWVISVTDLATGARTNVTVPVDPSTQSLRSLAAEIANRTNGRVSGSVNAETNSLDLTAAAGFAFDFAGRAEDSNATAVEDPDGAGVLASLGINSLFTGRGAAGIAVRPEFGVRPVTTRRVTDRRRRGRVEPASVCGHARHTHFFRGHEDVFPGDDRSHGRSRRDGLRPERRPFRHRRRPPGLVRAAAVGLGRGRE